jgi:hypothetical protein
VGRTVTHSSTAIAGVHGYTTTFLWASIIFLVGATATALVVRRRTSTSVEVVPVEDHTGPVIAVRLAASQP